MGNSLGPVPEVTLDEAEGVLDYEVTVQKIADKILTGDIKKIVVMAGAGISVSAGIPDFRSPKTGLYHNLQKYNLEDPTDIFDIEFFQENPEPFCMLAKELYPGLFMPTPAHYFIRLLAEKDLLLRCYTQNIDTLERVAGIDPSDLVEAHGSFGEAHCISCKSAYSQDWVKDKIFADVVPRCSTCHNLVKPDIVFFGENLPPRFGNLSAHDLPEADLLIVIGTSLTVMPFAGLLHTVDKLCPRLLINLTPAGLRDGSGHGLRLDATDNYRDVGLYAECDTGVTLLARLLGWEDELCALYTRETGRDFPEPKPMEGLDCRNWRSSPATVTEQGFELPPLLRPERFTPGEEDRGVLTSDVTLRLLERTGEDVARKVMAVRYFLAPSCDASPRDRVVIVWSGEGNPSASFDSQHCGKRRGNITLSMPRAAVTRAQTFEVWYVSADGPVLARIGPLPVEGAVSAVVGANNNDDDSGSSSGSGGSSDRDSYGETGGGDDGSRSNNNGGGVCTEGGQQERQQSTGGEGLDDDHQIEERGAAVLLPPPPPSSSSADASASLQGLVGTLGHLSVDDDEK